MSCSETQTVMWTVRCNALCAKSNKSTRPVTRGCNNQTKELVLLCRIMYFHCVMNALAFPLLALPYLSVVTACLLAPSCICRAIQCDQSEGLSYPMPDYLSAAPHVRKAKACHTPCLTACLLLSMQGQILLAAAFNGDADAASFLCELYANSTASSGTVIDPDLRGAAYHAAAAHLGGCLSLSGKAHAFLILRANSCYLQSSRSDQAHTPWVWLRCCAA